MLTEVLSDLSSEPNWNQIFLDVGASWTHGGDPYTQPFIRTSSGLLSAGCFRGRKIQEDPKLLALAANSLIRLANLQPCVVDRIVGSATSGIALSSHMALQLGAKTAFAEKDARSKNVFSFAGFTFRQNERVIITDDTITTGRTIRGVRDALLEACPTAEIIPVVLVLCNRSNLSKMDEYQIVSLITRTIERWEEGKNPYTYDGKEILPPVEPKLCV